MNRRLTPLLFAALLALPATAQRVSRDYLDTPMTQVLSDLAHAATQQRIVFIHNDLEDFTVTQRFDSLTIAEAIGQCIGMAHSYDGRNNKAGLSYKVQLNLEIRANRWMGFGASVSHTTATFGKMDFYSDVIDGFKRVTLNFGLRIYM